MEGVERNQCGRDQTPPEPPELSSDQVHRQDSKHANDRRKRPGDKLGFAENNHPEVQEQRVDHGMGVRHVKLHDVDDRHFQTAHDHRKEFIKP